MKLTDAQIRSVIAGHDADGKPHPVDRPTADALLACVLATPRDSAGEDEDSQESVDQTSVAAGADTENVRAATPAAPIRSITSGAPENPPGAAATSDDAAPSEGSEDADMSVPPPLKLVAASPVIPAGAAEPRSTTRRRPRHLGRWVAMAAAAAVIGGVIVGTPSPQEAALANWTVTPNHITDKEAAEMMKACREQLISPGPGPLMEGEPSKAVVDSMKTIIADRRGNATYGIMQGDGWMADCMAFSDPVWFLRTGRHISTATSMTMPIPDTEVPADGIADVNIAGTSDGESNAPDDPAFAMLNARAGGEVRRIVLHVPAGDVTATVASGWVAAWWPTTVGGMFPEPFPATLTLSDGSTREIADIGEFAWVYDEDADVPLNPDDATPL